MLIVAIDTSGKNGSLALVRFDVGADGDCATFDALEVVPLAGGSYSAQLIPALAAMLERHGLSMPQIDAYAVASGPGSFTGLRVGLSTVKALADATAKPIAAVTVLEAIAWLAPVQGRILIALDAGRQQVVVGEFLSEGRLRTPLSEHLLDLTQLAEQLKRDPASLFTPDANVASTLSAGGAMVTVVSHPAADLYGRIGAERILAGNTISPAELDANYVRRSDAEIFHQGTR
jgi:tRNA threonylcarbamoyladenosine biosynthesis protein TsaB